MRQALLIAAIAILATVVATSSPPVVADAPQPVIVTNFPGVQPISGRVVVGEPIPQTRFETRKAMASPADLSDTNHLTDAGALDTAGFTHVTLSLGGSLQGAAQAGAVGVVLVPDLPEVANALRTYGVVQFPLRVEAKVSPSQSGLFSSESTAFRLGFPRYRVLIYNATPKTADVTVYAYLGTS